ncbi:MAG: acetoin utilization protein AcuC [Gammaproteobacteria bacterium]|nr:acetoin utilization protein AcuC [Gammaproteobacteria bacterium]MCP5423669.1 acetoin utilization protein AcuC [Gammaproteobacteria bacterium]
MKRSRSVGVYTGERLNRYGFGGEHPLHENRAYAFWDEMHSRDLVFQILSLDSVMATDEQLLSFHTAEYIDKVKQYSILGEGYLDYGDTPAYQGVFEDAAHVVGAVVDAVRRIMRNEVRRAFVPIAGMHHSMPDTAAGFCVFNDIGVAIRTLLDEFGLERIGYVDIDAHHGDGVFYPFEDDPRVIVADIHEDGRYLFPATGFPYETGKGAARGRKLNIPMLPLSGDDDFLMMWDNVEKFMRQWEPQFLILNCGADGLHGDPLTHLHYSAKVHAKAAASLCLLAEEFAEGRIVAVGGGGYDLSNLSRAWAAVVTEFLEAPMP